MDETHRFVVRRRGNGYAVVDQEHMELETLYDTEAEADAQAHQRNTEPETRTYGVTWYCEVDAASEADAISKARKFLAPSYRENWDPTDVHKYEPETT